MKRPRGSIPTNITLGRKTWTPMEPGRTRRTTVRSGCRMNRKVGLPTATATGCGSLTTAGLGSASNLGAGRLITMGAGCGTAARGRGGRDRYGVRGSIVRSGRRLMFRSSGSVVVGDLASGSGGEDGAALDGCPSGLVTDFFRGGADIAGASGWWALTGLAR